ECGGSPRGGGDPGLAARRGRAGPVDPRGGAPPGHHRARRRGGVRGARPGRRHRHARRPAGAQPRVRRTGHRVRAGRRGTRPGARLRRRRHRGCHRMSERSGMSESTWRTLRRGLALSPELYRGLAGTLVLAIVMTAGRVAVPVAIQQGIDRGLRAPGGPDLGVVAEVVAFTAAVLVVAIGAGYLMMYRLFRVRETALAAVRTRLFR